MLNIPIAWQPGSLRWSQYTNIFKGMNDDGGILVHGVTGAIDLVSQDLLASIEGNSDPDSLPLPIQSTFLERGYLWSGSAEEECQEFQSVSRKHHEESIRNSCNTFWVIPTYKCNLRCYYCFQSHRLHKGLGLGKTDMSPEDAHALLEGLELLGGAYPLGPRSKGRYLTLFGGEPLLAGLKPTVTRLVSEAAERGYRIGAVTNGLELENYSEMLGPDKIRWLQITLDGIGKTNDTRRIPTCGPSYERIVAAINLALSRGAQVSLRTNVDRTILGELEALEDLAHREGWADSDLFTWYMSPLEPHGKTKAERRGVPMQEMVDTVVQIGKGPIRVPYRGKYQRLLKELQTKAASNFYETTACGAHTKMYFFDPAGFVYACAEQAGKPELAIGRFDGKRFEFDDEQAERWTSRYVGNMPICKTCPNALFCGGGCANGAMQESGDFYGPRCNGIKDAFRNVATEFASEQIALKRSEGKNIESEQFISLNITEKLSSFGERLCALQ